MSLLYTTTIPSPSSDNSEEARQTVQPVRETPIPEVDTSAESAIVTDSTDELTGLASRNAGAQHTPRERVSFIPDEPDYTFNDRQWATRGRAAALEASGQWGRGTFAYDESIAPVLTGAERLGGDTFSAERQLIQGSSGDFMSGVVVDNSYAALAAAHGARQARKAYAASLYEGWTS